MTPQEGGCLCGQLRYHVTTDPLWITACFCRFCQRATGAQGMVEPIFDLDAFAVIRGAPRVFTLPSEGSGQDIHVHFCDTCGTKTHLTFARWPDRLGVYSGTFDDPGWFAFTPENSKYIFLDEATRNTLVPAGFPTFKRHATENDGTPLEPEILTRVLHIR